MAGAVQHTLALALERRPSCPYIVTPNVDHVVKLEDDPSFKQAYIGAAAIYADGKPLVMLSALVGQRLPGVVPGSDLVPEIFHEATRTKRCISVYLLGAGPGVGELAAQEIAKTWGPWVQVVGTCSPDFGFENRAEENRRIIADINKWNPDVLVVGLGAPKQEIWVHTHQHAIRAGVALCVGATIDFLAGNKKRAPTWIRRIAMEWAYRLAQEPRRLAKRYLHDFIVFPRLVARELIRQKR